MRKVGASQPPQPPSTSSTSLTSLTFFTYVFAMNRPRVAAAVSEECVPNIGLRGRRRRLTKGVILLAITVGAFAWLVTRHAPSWAFLFIAPLSGTAALFFFQAKEKT